VARSRSILVPNSKLVKDEYFCALRCFASLTTLTEPRDEDSIDYGLTRNILLLVSVPLGVVTVTKPVVAPEGTFAVK
jgi:hypothetical protein